MRTIIPPIRGRPTAKLPRGRWRRWMATRFNRKKYGQRWQVESTNSMLKRLLDSALRARHYWSQWREIFLRVLTHNVMILWMGFSTEQTCPVICPRLFHGDLTQSRDDRSFGHVTVANHLAAALRIALRTSFEPLGNLQLDRLGKQLPSPIPEDVRQNIAGRDWQANIRSINFLHWWRAPGEKECQQNTFLAKHAAFFNLLASTEFGYSSRTTFNS